jgi:anion-transporting  ArsA/GET3 family ATPase
MQSVLLESLLDKKCILIAGAGGVGKTTTAAAVAVALARRGKSVLALTIDPSLRLAQALGIDRFTKEPAALAPEVLQSLELPVTASLHAAILHPKAIVEAVLENSVPKETADRIRGTLMYKNLSEMISGLQEYAAYEWVTRLIDQGDYDCIVLDTPPAANAKDFFKVPERITRLMESRVFQLFVPEKQTWFGRLLDFGWVERFLGQRVFQESRTFFSAFGMLRDHILRRCQKLERFFKEDQVAVVVVAAPTEAAWRDFEGLERFLGSHGIPIFGAILNQVHEVPAPLEGALPADWMGLVDQKSRVIQARATNDAVFVEQMRGRLPLSQLETLPHLFGSDPMKKLALLARGLDKSKRLD